MNKFPFDQKIAKVLQHLEDSYDPKSWEALREKLDNAPTAPSTNTFADKQNELFDQQVRAALEEIEAPYQHSHWNQLARELSQNTTIQRLRMHKVAEAAIILLFAANLHNIVNNGVQLFKMPSNKTPDIKEIPMAATDRPSKNKKTFTPYLSSSSISQNTTEQPIELSNNLLVNNILPESTPFLPIPFDYPKIGLNNKELPLFNQVELLQTLGFKLQDYPTTIAITGINTPSIAAKKASKPINIIAYSGIQRLHLLTERGFSTTTNTPVFGVAAAVNKGGWGVEVGASFSPLTHKTDTDVFELYQQGDQTYGISTDQVQASVISIPLKATRQIAHWGKNSLRATAGVAAHVAASKSYTYQHIPFPNPPQGSGIPGKPTLPVVAGVLDNGKIKDNFFTSAEVGIRYERHLNPRLIAYAEPVFRRQISGKGFGPQSSKISSATLQAGLITTL